MMNHSVNSTLDSALYHPVSDFIDRQGKRIRFGLMQSAFQLCGGRGELPVEVAESIEWLHAGSLVIDDIQDQSQERRGASVMHKQIGVPLAINAGNWMYFKALESLSTSSLAPGVRNEMLAAMISAGVHCHEGQAIDLSSRVNLVDSKSWLSTVESISRLKTGTLVKLATTMGAIAADAPRAMVMAMGNFGLNVGIALQMRNDLDELLSLRDSEASKTSYVPDQQRDDDLRNARVSWPWAWAVDTFHNSYADTAKTQRLAKTIGNSSVQPEATLRRTLRSVAKELLELSSGHGERIIASLMDRELRLLGEHVVEHPGLVDLEKTLEPIQRTVSATSDSIPVNA